MSKITIQNEDEYSVIRHLLKKGQIDLYRFPKNLIYELIRALDEWEEGAATPSSE